MLDHLLVIEQTVERSFNSEVEHDADSADDLMKRHIQSGYAEIQLIPAAKALKPHKALQEWRLGFEV